MRKPNRTLLRYFIPAATLLVVSLSGGCKAIQAIVDAPGNVLARGREKQPVVDPVLIQQNLLRMSDAFTSNLTAEITLLPTHNTTVNQAQILRWKLAITSGTCAIVSGANPIANLCDMTAFLTLTRMTMEDHWVPNIFGESGQPLIDSCRTADKEMWGVAKTVMTPSQQTAFQKYLVDWYRESPQPASVVGLRSAGIAAQFLTAKKSASLQSTSLFDLIKIDPLSGLDPATREIAQTRLFAERALYVAQKMPQIMRWQLELLNLNVIDSPTVQNVVANTTQLAASADRISRVAEQLPAQIDQQREAIFKGLESQEKQLTPLVGAFSQTLVNGRDMSTSLNTTFMTFDALMKRFGVGETYAPRSPGPSLPPRPPFRIQDYTEACAQLEKTSKQLTELLNGVNQTVAPANLERLATQIAPVVQHAKMSSKEVVDYAFIRGLQLIGAFLAGLLIYRFLNLLMARRNRSSAK